MSPHRGPTPDDASGSIEVKEAEQDIEMDDGHSGALTDAERDAAEDGEQKMFHIIQQLATHMSSVEEK